MTKFAIFSDGTYWGSVEAEIARNDATNGDEAMAITSSRAEAARLGHLRREWKAAKAKAEMAAAHFADLHTLWRWSVNAGRGEAAREAADMAIRAGRDAADAYAAVSEIASAAGKHLDARFAHLVHLWRCDSDVLQFVHSDLTEVTDWMEQMAE